MPATIAVREIHPELPADRAWQQGRRLYARCGRYSHLSGELHAMGAKWDVKEKALWIGSGKRTRFTTLALDHHERVTRLEAIRAAGHWVNLPYGADLIRVRVKDMGGIWDEERRQWALPTPADLVEITGLVEVWQRARDAERAEHARMQREQWETERREAALEAAGVRERERRRAAQRESDYRRSLADAVGRTLTGQVETRREAFPRYTSRETAHASAAAAGTVLRLQDGRRALVTRARVGFIGADRSPTFGQDSAHWYAKYTLAVVGPTEAELDAEMERAAQRMDAEELHALVTDAALLAFPSAGDCWTPVPDREGTVTVTTGVNGLIPAGHLILARDGALWWQHPGHYDDYVRAEGSTGDPDLVAFMRRVLAAGPRTRTLPGAPPLRFTVAPDA